LEPLHNQDISLGEFRERGGSLETMRRLWGGEGSGVPCHALATAREIAAYSRYWRGRLARNVVVHSSGKMEKISVEGGAEKKEAKKLEKGGHDYTGGELSSTVERVVR